MSKLWFEIEDLERLLWKPWRNGKVAWIFWDECEPLFRKIENSGYRSVRIGNSIYKIRRKERKIFIIRLPLAEYENGERPETIEEEEKR